MFCFVVVFFLETCFAVCCLKNRSSFFFVCWFCRCFNSRKICTEGEGGSLLFIHRERGGVVVVDIIIIIIVSSSASSKYPSRRGVGGRKRGRGEGWWRRRRRRGLRFSRVGGEGKKRHAIGGRPRGRQSQANRNCTHARAI